MSESSATTGAAAPDNGPVLVVGLGNPGPKYETNRHNIGQMVLDELASRTLPMASTFSTHKRSNAQIVQTRWKMPDGSERQVILAKARTYMNLSGGPVAALTKFFGVAPGNVVMVHDELDVDPGSIRLKRGGGEGGHNGLRSTSKSLGTKDYQRVRVGVGRPPGRQDPADYVLRDFATTERKDLPFWIQDAADAVELLVGHGLQVAQNQVHAK